MQEVRRGCVGSLDGTRSEIMKIISDGQAAQILRRALEERVSQKYATRLKVAGDEERRDIERQIRNEVAEELRQHLRSSAWRRRVPVIH